MYSLDKLGTTIDTSQKPRGSTFQDLVIRASWNPPPGQPLWPPPLNVDQLSLGGRFAINLIPWQASGSVQAASTFPRNHTFLAISTTRARIIVGTEGASETFDVDYPAAGTTVTVAGRTLQVELLGTIPGGPDPTLRFPVIGAYLSQSVGAPGPMTATLTTEPSPVAPESSSAEAVPPRARMFRLITDFAAPSAPAFNIAQVDGNGNPLGLLDFAGSSDSFKAPNARAAWYPLHPDCQIVSFANTDVANSQQLCVQWLLTTCG